MTAIVCVCAPTPVLAPRIEIVLGPTVIVLAALSVIVVARLVPVMVVGANTAVTPVGSPSADSVTSPVNVPTRLITIGIVVAAPCAAIAVVALADSVRPVRDTVSGSVAVPAVTFLPVARTVIALDPAGAVVPTSNTTVAPRPIPSAVLE